MAVVELTREGDVRFFQRPYIHARSGHQGHGCVQGLEAAHRQVCMGQLLQDFR